MGFTKTQSVEKSEVLTPDEHRRIQSGLHKAGKTSARDLTEDERAEILKPE